MKLADLQWPSKEWPQANWQFIPTVPAGTYTVLGEDFGKCLCWYQGPSLFRALLAWSRYCEFSDVGGKGCVYFSSEAVSTRPDFRRVWDATGEKWLARGRRAS